MIKPPSDFRKDIAPYRVFFTWDITYECNYKCSYCAFGGAPNAYKPHPTLYLEVPKWIKIWEEIYKRYGSCEIHFAGGEPFLYPDFMNLIENLSEIHTLEFSTNFFWKPEEFIKKIKPDRARIGLSFHPEFAEFNLFIQKALRLKEAGFEVWINYVAYPPYMDKIENYKNISKENGIEMSILLFKGKYNNMDYPDSYNEKERAILRKFSTSTWSKKSTDFLLNETIKPNSKICRMGQMYAKIYSNGDVFRCCAKGAEKLGNLVNGNFVLLEEAKECYIEECPCWKCMIVGNEDYWGPHWVVPKAARFFGDKYYK